MDITLIVVLVLLLVLSINAICFVRPHERALAFRLGRYHRFLKPGLNWLLPVVDRALRVDLREVMPGWEGFPEHDIYNLVMDHVFEGERPDEKQSA